MKKSRCASTSWRALGVTALAMLGAACAASDSGGSGGAGGQGGTATAGAAGSSAGNTAAGSAGSSVSGSGGSAGDAVGSTGGSGGSSGSGEAGSGQTGGGAGAGGATPDAGGGGGGSAGGGGSDVPVVTGPGCADPAKGMLDVPNVGTAPTAVTQADLAGASPATHYYMSVPGGLPAASTTDPAKQVGLFVTFHEHGSNPGVEMPSVLTSLAHLKRSGDFVVLGLPIDPNTTEHPYTTADHQRFKALLDYALKTWPINPRRVYLWGRGEGATMSDSLAFENKQAISSIITYSWGYDRSWPSNAANDQADVYMVIGLADYPDSHVPLVRRVYNFAKTAGFHTIYREVPGLKGPTADAITNDDAVAWAISTRHKTLPLSAGEEALLAPYKDAAGAQGICPDAAKFAQIELVGGLAAGKVMPAVLTAGNEASRVLAAQIAGRADFGDPTYVTLGARLKDASANVRKAAITALGVASNWRRSGAQKALIDFATDAAGNVGERALAVDAIGVAVKYQIGGSTTTGAYQDPLLFGALVTLLGDGDATIRTKAFNVLKPAMSSNYNPASDPASQASAISAWKTWQMGLK